MPKPRSFNDGEQQTPSEGINGIVRIVADSPLVCFFAHDISSHDAAVLGVKRTFARPRVPSPLDEKIYSVTTMCQLGLITYLSWAGNMASCQHQNQINRLQVELTREVP